MQLSDEIESQLQAIAAAGADGQYILTNNGQSFVVDVCGQFIATRHPVELKLRDAIYMRWSAIREERAEAARQRKARRDRVRLQNLERRAMRAGIRKQVL